MRKTGASFRGRCPVSDTTDISKCPKCGGARTHAEGGVSYGHCSSSWGVDWKTGVVTVYSQGMTCRIWELERELAEARRELVSQESECARLSVIVRDLNAQLAAHKAALEKCRKVIGDGHDPTCEIYWDSESQCNCSLKDDREEAISEIYKLQNHNVMIVEANAQLSAHKAALNLCEMALNSDMYGTFTDLKFEALSAIAKLKGSQ